MYDAFLYTIFNVIYTSAPPVIYSTMDKDVSIDSMMENPKLYTLNGERKWKQSYARFWQNMFLGIFHALIAFFVPYFGLRPYTYSNGFSLGMGEFGAMVYQNVVFLVNVRIAAICYNWTFLHHALIWGSILVFPATIAFLDYFNMSVYLNGFSSVMLSTSQYWMSLAGAVILGSLPTILIRAIESGKNSLSNRVLFTKKYLSPKVGADRKSVV